MTRIFYNIENCAREVHNQLVSNKRSTLPPRLGVDVLKTLFYIISQLNQVCNRKHYFYRFFQAVSYRLPKTLLKNLFRP